MELTKLNQLLEKYWGGELSEEAENQFKKALLEQKNDLSGDLKDLADWFENAEFMKDSIQLGDDFDEKVMSHIEKTSSKNQDSWSWWKIAAAVLVIITLSYTAIVIPKQKEEQLAIQENTATSPEKAFEETKATLALMASMMNNGKAQLESLELFKVAQEKIKNNNTQENNKKENS